MDPGEDLRRYPGLADHLLPTGDVQFTGNRIGAGAYGTVEEVVVSGAVRAAKRIHDFLQDPILSLMYVENDAGKQFVDECKLLASIEHPNIVKFFGIYFFPGARLPSLIMERLLISLHDLLELKELKASPELRIPLGFKRSILSEVASALQYLHERSPSIFHCDLSARNVVLSKDNMKAKLVDLGMAHIKPLRKVASTLTVGPGSLVYMPPEISPGTPLEKFNASIDVFSFGVLTIFTISETCPFNPLPPTYAKEEGGVVGLTELERRKEYIEYVNDKLRDCNQFREDHPFIQLIQQCLENHPPKRPSIHGVQNLLEQARVDIGGDEDVKDYGKRLAHDLSKHKMSDLVQCADIQPNNQLIHNLDTPYGIAINSAGELVVSEWGSHRVSILDTNGQNFRTFGASSDMQKQMRYPAGVAIDNEDNIYVSSAHKVQKFVCFEFKLSVGGEKGEEDGEFNDPRGLAIYDNLLYVSDRKNHRVQVFNLQLIYQKSIRGEGDGKFDEPFDVKFDATGKMYVAEFNNKRVQVLDNNGTFIRMIGQEDANKVGLPTGLCVKENYVYISDFTDDRIMVYTTDGGYHATLASRGRGIEKLHSPYCITSNNHNIFVCDSANRRIYPFKLLK